MNAPTEIHNAKVETQGPMYCEDVESQCPRRCTSDNSFVGIPFFSFSSATLPASPCMVSPHPCMTGGALSPVGCVVGVNIPEGVYTANAVHGLDRRAP